MAKQVRKKRGSKKPMVRVGRPPRERAGEVDQRILDAAHQVFLKHGLSGASIDEIARLARAGKPTIYARFPTKEALFTAVGMRNSASLAAQFENDAPSGSTMGERLASIGTNVLERLLASETIEFIRLSIAEARRFPELAMVGRTARERGVQAVKRVLSEVSRSDVIGAFPAFAPERLDATTHFFLDLIVSRFFTRALFGEDLAQLRKEIRAHVTHSVVFFLAACRRES